MSRELVSPEVGKTIVVELGPGWAHGGRTAAVRVVRRSPDDIGFWATMPNGHLRAFTIGDIAYVPANFAPEQSQLPESIGSDGSIAV